ncbi:lipocalin/fatty-acid binding family protein [Streptomyces sp. MNP-20]|uniref:lipocalin/fatty-acid binding family protein n=1 Tax=Streptomyces sp. MNP-20 TaxID=2721165 RepID=UPI0015564979|nr:lipocalin/fatty-acid binding family protein [Streptomyces sp. MNP-20]
MELTSKWEMVSSDNYGEYLKAVGVGMIQRNLAEKAIPTEELTATDGRYKLTISTPLKKTEVSFSLGEPVDTTSFDGRAINVTFVRDGNKLIEVQKTRGDAATITRDYGETGMTATYTAKGVTATRVFKRL